MIIRLHMLFVMSLFSVMMYGQNYIHLYKTEAELRSQVKYDVDSYIDTYTGKKVLWYLDEGKNCRVLSYVSNVTRRINSTILMVSDAHIEEWVDRLNSTFIAVSEKYWRPANNDQIVISLQSDRPNSGWIILFTDKKTLNEE